MIDPGRVASSFRDPSGFVFRREGRLLRQINRSYREPYERMIGTGLYDRLAGDGLLIRHQEVEDRPSDPGPAYKVIAPEEIPFVSYPYEWCVGQLKAAALLTLEVQGIALESGMTLKDASAYNVQFRGSRPILIDTLSFEPYREGETWVAYRQFCRHFLAPLALMSRVDVRLGQLLARNIDGVPLDLASALLPWGTRLSPSLLFHIHLHAGAQRRYDGRAERPTRGQFSRTAFLGLLDSLASAVRGVRWEPKGTEWADYYDATNYTAGAAGEKRRLVAEYLATVAPATAWDLGANTGEYSRLASESGAETVAFDVDPACVERNYRESVRLGEARLLPLLLDLTNPSPAIGWHNRERMSLAERGPADVVLALALVHHLAISHNVPLRDIAAYLRLLGRHLIIEFVPKDDSQVGRLLVVREDIFGDYNREHFESSFAAHFDLERVDPIRESGRILYLMRSRGA